MKEISDKDLINLIKGKFPKFIPYWEDYVSECEGEDLGISNDVRPFTRYVTAEIKSENFQNLRGYFY